MLLSYSACTYIKIQNNSNQKRLNRTIPPKSFSWIRLVLLLCILQKYVHTSHHIISYHIIPHDILFYSIISYHITIHYITSHYLYIYIYIFIYIYIYMYNLYIYIYICWDMHSGPELFITLQKVCESHIGMISSQSDPCKSLNSWIPSRDQWQPGHFWPRLGLAKHNGYSLQVVFKNPQDIMCRFPWSLLESIWVNWGLYF